MSRRTYRGWRSYENDAISVIDFQGAVIDMDPCHDVWVFGEGRMDWATRNGAKQLALAMLMDATESVSVATLWCEDYADSFFGGEDVRDEWETCSEDICRWIIDRVKDELFGVRPPSAARNGTAEVNGDGHQ